MKAFRFLQALPLALMLFAAPVRAEQGTIVGPVVGPKTMTDVMTTLNAALLAIQSCNSGTSAPANGVGGLPTRYQCWMDTTTNPSLYKIYDGTSWITLGTINTSTHAWLPYLTGGVSGGVPFFSTTNVMGSSALLAQYGFMVGGGAGAPPATIAACTDDQIAFGRSGNNPLCRTVTGDISFATGVAAIGPAKVTFAMIQNVAAMSVFGRASNSAGVGADITAANDAEVMRRSGTTIGFGTLATAGITDDAVTNPKLANMANGTTKCRTTALTGDPEDCTASQMRSLLTLVVGTDVQAFDADLAAIAGLTSANNKCFYFTGAGTAATYDCSSFGRSVANVADAAALRTIAAAVIGTNVQAWDADLDCMAANSTAGLMAYTGAGTCAYRTLTAPAAGFTITNPAATAGNPTFVLANDLAALEALASTGFAVRTGTDTWAQRTLQQPAAGLTWTNPAGIAGDPAIALANDLAALEGLSGTGIARRTGTDAWSVGTTVSVAEGGSGLASGTSGGVLCFTGTTTAASSALLTQYGILIGGGAGACPVAMAAGTDGQIVIGQTGAAPLAKTIAGDITVTAAGVVAVGATKITSAMLNADVFSTARSWGGPQTFVAPILGAATATSLKTASIFPPADSTTALQIFKADGSTRVVAVDTTNARVGINKTPGAFDLDVNGAANFGGAVTLGGGLSAALPLTSGGSGQVSALLARGSSGFNIDQMTTNGDANLTISATTRTVATTATLTAARTFTLPAANALNAGQTLVILDQAGGVNGGNVINVARAGTDTINGSTSVAVSTQYGGMILTSDGASKWTSLSTGGGGGGGSGTVVSVGSGLCITGGPISVSGTLALDPSCVQGYISGLTLSTAGSSATYSVASGVATDSGSTYLMALASSLSKTTSAWSVGAAGGGLDTGTIANSTWYHAFIMRRPDTGVVDSCVSVTVSGCTTGGAISASYTQFRRIGSMKTNGSAQWTKFTQVGNDFLWDVSLIDVNGASGSASAQTVTITVPTGVQVVADLNAIGLAGASADGRFYISSLDKSDETPTVRANAGGAFTTNFFSASNISVRTSANAQIRYRAEVSTATLYLSTNGWSDARGGPSGPGATATAPSATVLQNYIAGLTLSTAGSSATYSIATGSATDSNNAAFMVLSAAMSKTTGTWAVGSGNGGLDAGTIANSTWYHAFIIQRPDTNVVDSCVSTSVSGCTTGGNIPSAYTQQRRIGSMKTNGSAQWTAFTQNGNEFTWNVSVADLSVGTWTSTASDQVLTVPTGIVVDAFGSASFFSSTGGQYGAVYSKIISDFTVNSTNSTLHAQNGITSGSGVFRALTNASATVRKRSSDASGTGTINTYGWIDTRNAPSLTGGGQAVNLVCDGVTITGVGSCPVKYGFSNCTLAASAAASALTIAVKDNAGADPSAVSPCVLNFRNVTATSGTLSQIVVNAATSLVISSGSTMGVVSSTAFRIWVVGINDGGTFRLGAANSVSGTSTMPIGKTPILSSTAEGGLGAADSAQVFYTGTAVTSKAYMPLGYLEWSASGVTAGTWTTTNLAIVQTYGTGIPLPGEVIQTQRTLFSAKATGTTQIPNDSTIPQNTEGDQYMTQAITPTSAANILRVTTQGFWANTGGAAQINAAALFQDSVANALTVGQNRQPAANSLSGPVTLNWSALSNTLSSTTFKVRAGTNSAVTTTFNGENNTDPYGANMLNSFMQVEEIMSEAPTMYDNDNDPRLLNMTG